MIWGIGATLREQSLVDTRHGGFLNSTMEDPVGVKGLGEVAMVGVSAAIGNAVFHAIGTRHRRLPIRIEDVLASL